MVITPDIKHNNKKTKKAFSSSQMFPCLYGFLDLNVQEGLRTSPT